MIDENEDVDKEIAKIRSKIHLLELEIKACEAWIEYVDNKGAEHEPAPIREYMINKVNEFRSAKEFFRKDIEYREKLIEDLLAGKSIIPAFRKIQIEEELLASENGEGYVKTDE